MKCSIFLLIVVFSVIFFFAISSAQVFSGNFIISYGQDSPVERTFIFQNDSVGKTVSLDISGTKTPWTYITPTKETIQGFCASSQDIVLCIAPSNFSIAANTSKEIYLFSKAKTFAKPGDYQIDILENSNKIGTFVISVEQGHLIELTATEADQTSGQCEKKDFSVEVSNNGTFDEEIVFSVSGLPIEWLSQKEQSDVILRNSSKTFSFSVIAPCDAVLEKYSFLATATSARAGVSASEELSYTIENTQELSIQENDGDEDTVIDACRESETKKSISITNHGKLAEEIIISLNAPEWVLLSEKNLSLGAGETKNVTITAQKTLAAEKQYSAILEIKSAKFGNTAAKTILLNLKNCYGFEITKGNATEKACIGDKPTVEFTVTNKKENPVGLNASVTGATVSIDKKNTILQSNESQKIIVTIDTAKEKPGKKEIEFTVSSDYFSKSEKTGIELLSCGIEIIPEKQFIDVNTTIGTLTKITVSNNSLSIETIRVTVKGKEWILFNPKEFSINAGEKKDVFMYISPAFNTENGMQKAEISAIGQKYLARKSIDLNIFGGIEIGKENIAVSNIEIRNIGERKEIKARIFIKNDSNISITIKDIVSSEFETSYAMKNNKILANENNPVEITISLPKTFDKNQFQVPLTIATEKGLFNKIITIDISPKEESSSEKETIETTENSTVEILDKNNNDKNQTATTGMAFLLQPKNILLVAAIIALIALVAYLSLKKDNSQKETEETATQESKNNSIHSIAEQVKAKSKKTRKKK